MKNNHEELYQKLDSLHLSTSLTKKEVFTKKLEIELEQIHRDRSFLLIMFKEFPHKNDDVMSKINEDFRIRLIKRHKDELLEVYGERIKATVWDLTTILEGMMKEYISLIVFQGITISIKKLTKFIVAHMDTLAESIVNMEPILNEELLCNSNRTSHVSIAEQLDDMLSMLKPKVERLTISDNEKEKLLDCLTNLRKECQQEVPALYLIEALSLYLKTQPELEKKILQFEKLVHNLIEGEK
ncbi:MULTISPECIES: hypothetical protein [Paraliobacillus]|uniref:hypothetical protein n=1 Tax=Paraliobacillus TaxID=200903 RepID=UPI001E31CBFA|nr:MULTISPECIES: hypothetical protein [Paraliobacillus]